MRRDYVAPRVVLDGFRIARDFPYAYARKPLLESARIDHSKTHDQGKISIVRVWNRAVRIHNADDRISGVRSRIRDRVDWNDGGSPERLCRSTVGQSPEMLEARSRKSMEARAAAKGLTMRP